MHSTSTIRVKVEPGGTGVAAHVGLHALGAFADQIGLGAALSGAIEPTVPSFGTVTPRRLERALQS